MLDLHDQLLSLEEGKTTSVELVNQALAKIEDSKDFNIFLQVFNEEAQAAAKVSDQKRAAKDKIGLLEGIPFAVKDNFLVSYGKTTAASLMLEDFESPYTASSVKKLLDEGAILIGKTNLDSYAHGASTENSAFGPTKNPKDPTRVPGGSSGGSAAAIAADIVSFTLGSDTGGSIRLPASFTGVLGYKPSYGLVSRYGVVAMVSSTDCIGPFASTVKATKLITSIIAGKDKFDGTTIDSNPESLIENNDDSDETTKKKIGIIKELSEGLSDDVQKAYAQSIQNLRDAGHQIVELSIPSVELALSCYYVITPAEVSSNLSRYDGQRYGLQAEGTTSLEESFTKSRTEGFMPENIRRIIIGTYVLSSGYYDAYYKKAQKVRTRLKLDFEKAFKKVDIMVSPVAPFTAFKIGEKVDDPVMMYLVDIMTVSMSLIGAPAISVPITVKDGMPVGLQIFGAHGDDKNILNFAEQVEKVL